MKKLRCRRPLLKNPLGCIDKTSSAELQEGSFYIRRNLTFTSEHCLTSIAINYMYRWCAEADIC